MAIIGFIALLILGGYLIFCGAAHVYIDNAFRGETPWQGLFVAACGFGVLYLTFANAPFVVVIN